MIDSTDTTYEGIRVAEFKFSIQFFENLEFEVIRNDTQEHKALPQ